MPDETTSLFSVEVDCCSEPLSGFLPCNVWFSASGMKILTQKSSHDAPRYQKNTDNTAKTNKSNFIVELPPLLMSRCQHRQTINKLVFL